MTLADRMLRALETTRRLVLPRLPPTLKAELAASFVERGRLAILVADSHDEAEALRGDLSFMLGTSEDDAQDRGILFLGGDAKTPYDEHTPDARSVMERLDTLYRLRKDPRSVRALIVTPEAFVRRHVPPSFFDAFGDYLVQGERIERDAFLRRLVDTGYNSVATVEDPGTFSVRGGIIDIFSPSRSRPIRLDMFGDDIESIRPFDPETQRTLGAVEDAIVLPAREIAYSDDAVRRVTAAIERLADETLVPTRKLDAVLDDVANRIHFFGIEAFLPLFHADALVGCDAYLSACNDAVFLLGDLESVASVSERIWDEARDGFARARASHVLALPPEEYFDDGLRALSRASERASTLEMPAVALGEGVDTGVKFEPTDVIRAEILRSTRSIDEPSEVLHPLVHRLRRWRSDGMTTILVCHSRGQAERVRELLAPKNVSVRLARDPFSLVALEQYRDRSVHAWLVVGEISAGFVLPEDWVAFVSEEEVFGKRVKAYRRRAHAGGEIPAGLRDLEAGDHVVHLDYGIGLYKGMTKLAVNGVDGDYLAIEYKGGDKLYLPVHRLRLIQKFVGASEGISPSLDKLGTQSWANTKKKVKDTLLRMAAELLRLYAARASLDGFALATEGDSFKQFEAEFAFDPTPDQQKAIEAVLEDLGKGPPMDRLICGDVGYGKTEVAMRAAMFAVLAGKQVAVLVPTTVLAAQHFAVFSDRFQNCPANIGVVSRFQPREEIEKTLDGCRNGAVDVVIGTHRLLSNDVAFKDLGLLIIDEEHRFGVAHKERLKKYRTSVHVLSMSATPIPRTLHMGFMGVRDMSIMATPPPDRLAVKTEVHKFSEEIIRDAILREIRRGGQCFVVHNRVASIGAFARFIERLVPEARVVVGHGQMQEERLEKVMVDFMNREFNVLVSTTIIESGLDIANANTIVVNRADRLGLAQLYQLRGRVGRSKARAFACFLVPAGNLTKKARRRIEVLQRFTELGAGFEIASRDLEIRGAGNILGKQQSGTIAQVGFDMYQALMAEAIDELRGSHKRAVKEPEIQLPVPALIPDRYVPAPGERLAYYQRFNAADTDDETWNLLQEMSDLFGSPPAELENLVQLMLVKQRLSRVGALGLDFGKETKTMPARVVVRFDPEEPRIEPRHIVEFINKDPVRRRLTPDGKLILHLEAFEHPGAILEQSKARLDDLVRIRARG